MKIEKTDFKKYLHKPVWLILLNKGCWVSLLDVGKRWVHFEGHKMAGDVDTYGVDWVLVDVLDILNPKWDRLKDMTIQAARGDDVSKGEVYTIVDGDLRDAAESVICHQVNCQGVMGAGVALSLMTKWPVIKEKYKKLFTGDIRAQRKLLGKVQLVKVDENKYVANIFGQYDYGSFLKNPVYTDYEALRQAFTSLVSKCPNMTFAFPYGFGAGLAGGDWEKVVDIIKDCFPCGSVTIYRKSEGVS